jgi:hypothetical protein
MLNYFDEKKSLKILLIDTRFDDEQTQALATLGYTPTANPIKLFFRHHYHGGKIS